MKFVQTLFFTSVFLTFNLHCEGKRVESKSLEELVNAGWTIHGTKPSFYSRPGQWKEALQPLDASVTGGSVWRLTSKDDTLFRLNIRSCHITNIKIYVTSFMENAVGNIYPCTGSNNFSKYCNIDPFNGVEWIRNEREIEVTDNETVIEVKVNVLSQGYVFFDQITVEHDGLDDSFCAYSTTEDPTTPPITEDPSTPPITDDPSTPPITEDPSTPPLTEDPPTPPLTEDPSTPPITDDPSTPPLTEDPSTSPETDDPSTPPLTEDPSTSPETEDPSTPSATEDPTTPPITEDPTTPLPDPTSCNHDCEYRRVDCHVYYTCINFTYKEFHTCSLEDDLAFNPSLKTCDLIENVDGCRLSTTKPPPNNCVCEYHPDETDCSKYFYCPDSCQENLCEHRSCPSGLAWTVDKYGDGSGHQQCTLPQNATCAGADPIVEFACKKKADGVYRNPKDCHSFWKCINGQALLYDCPHDLIYNPDNLECDFPSKAMRFCDKF